MEAPEPLTSASPGTRARKQAAPRPSRATPAAPVWIFYATPDNIDDPWVRELEAGKIVFWWHGRGTYERGGGAPYSREMKRGDSVIMLVGERLVASGVLAAGPDMTFVDDANVRWWPILVVMPFIEPISRPMIEKQAGKLIPHQGTVHPLRPEAMGVINLALGRVDEPFKLPLDAAVVESALAEGEGIEAALARLDHIRPDAVTALLLRKEGARPPPRPAPKTPETDARIRFVDDAPAETEDGLDRGPLALFLARRLHMIWCEMNHCSPGSAPAKAARPWDRDTFIVHVDAPWGGGKTTFANFVARTLNPGGEPLTEGHFLRSSLAPTLTGEALAATDLSGVFVPDYARDDPKTYAEARQPWIVARHNAWRDQYAQPPWWQVFTSVYDQVTAALRQDIGAAWRGVFDDDRIDQIPVLARKLTAYAAVHAERLSYKLLNTKVRVQLLLVAVFGLAVWAALSSPAISAMLGKTVTQLTALGFGGVAMLTLFTVLGQSLAPDVDFTPEHKQIGVGDPVGRFRRMFDKVLRAAGRPVLLIVDDLDRCDPQGVVEVLRGLQTIVRSPRLFVLVLGDRAWIETSHEISHEKLASLTVGAEAKLGARFVEKVFQLSFRLPAMKPEMRDLYTRANVEGRRAAAVVPDAAALTAFVATLDESLAAPRSVSRHETEIEAAKVSAEASGIAREVLDALASRKLVAAAGADAGYQAEVSSVLSELAASLPNNPRQIKRIMNAFAIYETVGRIYFNYQLTEGDDAESARRARRWRQLAMWVTLATEWPETWRAIGRRPELLVAAYGPEKTRAAADKAFLRDADEAEAALLKLTLHRMRHSRSLRILLDRQPAAAAPGAIAATFAETAMEVEAVREFNRIIWEPGFDTSVPASHTAPTAA